VLFVDSRLGCLDARNASRLNVPGGRYDENSGPDATLDCCVRLIRKVGPGRIAHSSESE
jgi:hypothetical protein